MYVHINSETLTGVLLQVAVMSRNVYICIYIYINIYMYLYVYTY